MRREYLRWSNHALKRYREYAGVKMPRRLQRKVEGRLLNGLRLGLECVVGATFQIEISDVLFAIIEPSMDGGWVVVTVGYRKAWINIGEAHGF